MSHPLMQRELLCTHAVPGSERSVTPVCGYEGCLKAVDRLGGVTDGTNILRFYGVLLLYLYS